MKNNTSFEDIMRCLGYEKVDCKVDMTGGIDNKCKNMNLDILGGFQDVEPMLMVLIAEVLANAISGDLPAQAINSLGNWLQLIGQVIQMYNAQQQYYQSGPGRYFNKDYKNVSNPFCTNPQEYNGSDHKEKRTSKKKKRYNNGNDEN